MQTHLISYVFTDKDTHMFYCLSNKAVSRLLYLPKIKLSVATLVQKGFSKKGKLSI